MLRSWSSGTFIGPGDGAVPGAGCGNAVERAVWKVTLPSTFCIIWWIWPLSTVTEPKLLEVGQRLGAVVRAPAPVRIDRPQRDVGEHDDRRRCRTALDVVLQPFELLGAEIAQTAGFEVDDIDQADEMHAVGVEAVPAVTLGGLAVTLAINFAIGIDEVVFAGHVMHVEPRLRNDVIGVVEFLFLRQMGDVAGVDHEGRLLRQAR